MKTLTKSITTKLFFIGYASLLIILSLFLTFLIHLIPSTGVPIRARLLPMFYVPFLTIALLNLRTGLVIALFSPVVNYLMTGNPQLPIVTILTIELILYTLFVYFLYSKNVWLGLTAPLGYVFTKTLSSGLLFILPLVDASPISFWFNSIQNAWIGLLILSILGVLLVVFKKK